MTRVLCDLDLQYLNGRVWRLRAFFKVYSDVLGGELGLEQGDVSDFNSTPRLLWNLLPPTEYGEAAWVHDLLYKLGTYNGKPVDRATADRVHREFVIWAGVRELQPDGTLVRTGDTPAWKVKAYYGGLRLGGWLPWRRSRAADLTTKQTVSD